MKGLQLSLQVDGQWDKVTCTVDQVISKQLVPGCCQFRVETLLMALH